MHKIGQLKDIKSAAGKLALVRVDFNEPFEHGVVQDSYRIRSALPTVKYLKGKGAHVILVTHFEDTRRNKPVTIAPFIKQFARILGEKLVFVKSYSEKEIKGGLKKGTVILENVRLHAGEEKNENKFAKDLAGFVDMYVNEAFSVSHRKHASIVGVPRYVPSYAGLTFFREIEALGLAIKPPHPFLLVIGGAKFKTKFALLKNFTGKADAIFLGGVLANTFFAALGYNVGGSVYDKSAIAAVKKHFLKKKNIIIPFDVRVQKGGNVFSPLVKSNEKICDVGDESLKALVNMAKSAKLVVWNGPLGHMEAGYNKNTFALLRALTRVKGKVMLGGGDTLAALDDLGIHNKFYHVSTGGGAMLDFLADGTLPGIEALKRSRL